MRDTHSAAAYGSASHGGTAVASHPDPTLLQALPPGPVVVATGGDDLPAVLRAGALLSDQLQRDAVVVSALDPLQQYGWQPGYGAYPMAAAQSLVAARRQRLEAEIARTGGSPHWPLTIELGGVPRVLARVAQERHASVLVMGIGRHRPVDRLLGTETVLRTIPHARCPVLAVPRDFAQLPSVAVVGVDFSPAGQHALRAMLAVVAPGAVVHLVHVWQPSGYDDRHAAERDDIYRTALPGRFQQLIGAAGSAHGATLLHEVREGQPAEQLLAAAESHRAGLVVIGRHGQGLLERLLVGRVASRVLRGADCAVLVVPEPAPAPHERVPMLDGAAGVRYPRGEWERQLEAFSRRNAGRVTILEVSDAGGEPYSRESGYVLFGAAYHERPHEIEIILGEANGRRRHLTRIIPHADALIVFRDRTETDRGFRVEHGPGQTTLTLLTDRA